MLKRKGVCVLCMIHNADATPIAVFQGGGTRFIQNHDLDAAATCLTRCGIDPRFDVTLVLMFY